MGSSYSCCRTKIFCLPYQKTYSPHHSTDTLTTSPSTTPPSYYLLIIVSVVHGLHPILRAHKTSFTALLRLVNLLAAYSNCLTISAASAQSPCHHSALAEVQKLLHVLQAHRVSSAFTPRFLRGSSRTEAPNRLVRLRTNHRI